MLLLSDFLVLALPLTAGTRHLIGADTIGRMKRGCCLVNTARGSIVDEEAVANTLSEEKLGGYVADVFEVEDFLRCDRPASISPRLLTERSRTVFTPHLGSAEHKVRRAAEFEMARSILDYFSGQAPRGAVNNPAKKPSAIAC